MRAALRITTDSNTERLDLDAGDSLTIMQHAVGGLITTVARMQDGEMYANDEGLLVADPVLNRLATGLAGHPVFGDAIIVGPARAAEFTGLADALIAWIERVAAALRAADADAARG